MQEQLTISRLKGHHLTAFERGEIVTMHNGGDSNRTIARYLGVCPQTINNELKRGQTRQVKKINGKRQFFERYVPELAQARYEANRHRCHRPSKFDHFQAFLAFFSQRFRDDGWSPDTVVGRARLTGEFTPDEVVSTAALYTYID